MHRTLLFLWFAFPLLSSGQESQTNDARTHYDTLIKEYDAAVKIWQKDNPSVGPEDPSWSKRYESSPDWTFAPRLVRFAETNPKEAVARAALLKVFDFPSTRDKFLFSSFLRARDLLTENHLEDESVLQACFTLPTPVALNMEPYFRALLTKSKDRDTLGRACMALVRCNQARMRVAARPFFDHLDDRPERAKTTAFLNSRLDPSYIEYIRSTDHTALTDENETLLDRVAKEFGDIPVSPRWAKTKLEGRTFAEPAKKSLEAIRTVAVGQVAPEIEGEDIDGKPMRLSDYRGKVVVLVFWGTWCAPCRGLLPKEKALVERLKDQPFALLGINSDSDRQKLRKAIADEGITWRSWWDGGNLRGPISNRWDVNGWPTIIVLDKAGRIRFKGLPHHTMKPLDDAVDSLLRE